MLFHPHASTASTTAEAEIAVAIHFHQVRAGSTNQLTWSLEHLVVATQEAWIVVRNSPARLRSIHRRQAALTDQLVQQLRVVHNRVIAAHLWVLILQGVEAVRTRHNDLALFRWHTLERFIEDLNILLRQHLEQELVTSTTSGVTGTTLTLAKHGELHTSSVQQFSNRTGGLGSVVVVHTGTTNPEQVLGVVEVLDIHTNYWHVDTVGLGLLNPFRTQVVVLAPRVALRFHVLEQTTELSWELGINQHLVTTHVHNVVNVLNIDWALFHTCATVGAGPQDIRIDDAHFSSANQLEEWEIGVGVESSIIQTSTGEHALATLRLGTSGLEIRSGVNGVIAKRGDQQLRRQRLGGVPRRTLFLAAATFRTGREVHPALPGEVVDPASADLVLFWVSIFHGEDASTGGHWLRSAERVAAIGVALQEDIEERHEAVPCHTPLDVLTYNEQPDHARKQLDQCEDGNQECGLRQEFRDVHREEIRGCVAAVVRLKRGDLGSLHEDHAQTLDQDHCFDEVCGARVGAVEACLLFLVADALADNDQRQNAQYSTDAENFVNEVVRGELADDWPAAFWVENLDVGLKPHDRAEEEADHHEPVGKGDTWFAGHLGVAEYFLNEVAESLDWVVQAVQRGLSESDRGEDLRRATDEVDPGWERQQCADDAQWNGDIPRDICAGEGACSVQVHGFLLDCPVEFSSILGSYVWDFSRVGVHFCSYGKNSKQGLTCVDAPVLATILLCKYV